MNIQPVIHISLAMSGADKAGGRSQLVNMELWEAFTSPYNIRLSCGNSPTIDDLFKLEDIPCPCGDPSHWLVKWNDTTPGDVTECTK